MTIKEIAQGGLFIALGIIFPLSFHGVGLGPVFLPMFFPLLVAGFMLSPRAAIPVGLITPVLSHLITQMPPAFLLPLMTVEGIILAGLPAIMGSGGYRKILINLLITLALDRVAIYVMIEIFSPFLNLPPDLTAISAVLWGIPGLIAIVVVIPIIVLLLELHTRKSLVHSGS